MSIPAWYTQIKNLSGGERERLNIALLLKNSSDIVIIDEFSSLVDRATAKGLAKGVSSWCRKNNKKLVIASIHNDIFSYMYPDWIWSTTSQKFITYQAESLQIKYEVGSVHDWPQFQQYHYLSTDILPASSVILAVITSNPDEKIGFIAISSQLNGGKRVHRLVVLPHYQGLGIGSKLLEHAANFEESKGYDLYIKTSHPAMGRYLEKSSKWSPTKHNLKKREDKFVWQGRDVICWCYKYNRKSVSISVPNNEWNCLIQKGKIGYRKSNNMFVYKRKNYPTLQFNTEIEARYTQYLSSVESGCNPYKIINNILIIKIKEQYAKIPAIYLDNVKGHTWHIRSLSTGLHACSSINGQRVYLEDILQLNRGECNLISDIE